MEQTLIDYVNATMTLEQAAMLTRADTVLRGLGYHEHHVAFEGILALDSSTEAETTRQRVYDVFHSALEYVINQYSIMIDHYDIPIMLNIITGMSDILNHDDRQGILAHCEEPGDPDEILCAILADIYNGDPMEYQTVIGSVSPNIINRIVAEVSQYIEEPEEEEEEVAAVDQAALRLKSFVEKYKPTGFMYLLEIGYRAGYQIDVYLKALIDPEMRDPEIVAREYVASGVAAGMTHEQILMAASHQIENLLIDLPTAQRAFVLMRGYSI